MVILKFTLDFQGSEFDPDKITPLLGEDTVIFDKSEGLQEIKFLSLLPATAFSVHENAQIHINWFIKFIDTNFLSLVSAKVEDIIFLTEIFYFGAQCNLDIFNQEFYDAAKRFKLKTPISVYKLNKKEFYSIFKTAEKSFLSN